MQDQPKKCKGIRKDGKPCEKFPLTGEDYCEKHHPIKILRRKLKKWIVAYFSTILLMIVFFVCDRYFSAKSTRNMQTQMSETESSLKEDFRQHSLAERILDSQYSPIKLTKLLEEVLNLMNNDPDFKKRFYIDGQGIRLQTEGVYGQDFTVNFATNEAREEFERFLRGGRKRLTIKQNDYSYFYILRNGEVVDSFSNEVFDLVRDFPVLPLLNISTIDPTADYLCTSTLNVQVDSISDENFYLSNESQKIPFKIRLKYDMATGRAEFHQLEDIYFDQKSPFYSLDQEICYYEFWVALISNARVRIRDALTGDSILTTEHFIPVNILPGPSFESLEGKLSILRVLKRVQDLWGVIFTRSNLTKEEFQYLKVISHSFGGGSRVTKFPFTFRLPEEEASKLIDRKANIEKGPYTIICNKNSVDLLGETLPLGRLAITLPRSHLNYDSHDNTVTISVSPIQKDDVVIYKYSALCDFTRPSNIIYSEFIPPYQDESPTSFVSGIKMPLESWENTAAYEGKSDSD